MEGKYYFFYYSEHNADKHNDFNNYKCSKLSLDVAPDDDSIWGVILFLKRTSIEEHFGESRWDMVSVIMVDSCWWEKGTWAGCVWLNKVYGRGGNISGR